MPKSKTTTLPPGISTALATMAEIEPPLAHDLRSALASCADAESIRVVEAATKASKAATGLTAAELLENAQAVIVAEQHFDHSVGRANALRLIAEARAQLV